MECIPQPVERGVSVGIIGESDEYLSLERQLARYQTAIRILENLGIRIPPSCRLRAYERFLNWIINEAGPRINHQQSYQLAIELREIDEFIEITEGLPDRLSEVVLRKLQALPGGKRDPDADANTQARDTQFELYLDVVLRRGGLQVDHTEPDLVVSSPSGSIQIAAKRPGSTKKFDDRLRSAIHQTECREIPAVIAISLDHVLRPRHKFLEAASEEAIRPEILSYLTDFESKNASAITRRVAWSRVSALLLTARIPGRIVPGNLPFTATNIHIIPTVGLGTEDNEAIQTVVYTIANYLS